MEGMVGGDHSVWKAVWYRILACGTNSELGLLGFAGRVRSKNSVQQDV